MSEDAAGRRYAIDLFNQTWELIEKSDRSPDEDLEMLLSAAASRWHWGEVGGGPEQTATGDWQLAHVASLLGFGSLALPFAERSLRTALAEEWSGWRLASAYEGVARAYAALGDADLRLQHVTLATQALEQEADDEDRAVIATQIASIPPVSGAPAGPVG